MRDGARHSWLLSTEGELATGQRDRGMVQGVAFPTGREALLHPASRTYTFSDPKRHSCPSSSPLDTPITLSAPIRPVVLQERSPQTSRIHITWAGVRTQILEPHPDLLSQKLWGGAQHSVSWTSPPTRKIQTLHLPAAAVACGGPEEAGERVEA